jgi:hypothetical protein
VFYVSRNTNIRADSRLTGNYRIAFSVIDLRSDEIFGIYSFVYYFNPFAKRLNIFWLCFAGNIATKDKKLDVKYL